MVALWVQAGMGLRNGKERVAFWLAVDDAKRFKALARVTDGGASQALTRMVGALLEDADVASPVGVGASKQVSVRFREDERAALAEAATSRETTPANWVRSLALVHLMRRPKWNRAELDEIREVAREARRIGANINQIARATNIAAQVGQCPPDAAREAKSAAEEMHAVTRRLAGILTGNFDYWGLPDEARPKPRRGGLAAANAREARAKLALKNKARNRPDKFKE